jgi:ABC-2 type transport system ATP-binding protein
VSTSSPHSIDVRGLNKSFGRKHVVNDVSMRVQRGEIFGFLGPNGSGKTTTIRMMCGLLTPDSGTGTCLGFDIRQQQAQIKRRVGYMTQRFSFWEDLSIRENLDFVARMYEMRERRRAVAAALEGLGLTARAGQLAGALSGGWKQRLALAACMLHDPQLLLLDEPTAGVDPKARREFWDELHRLAARGVSVLVSTHYMDEAERCHKLAYIAYGRLMTQGTAAEIIAEQGLTTWIVVGDDLTAISDALAGQPGVDQTAVFGSALHVTGKDGAALEATVRRVSAGSSVTIERADAGLEDVFIHLMTRSRDNFGDTP